MKNKLKLITLIILINLSFKAMGEEKYNSELIVSGKDMWERVDYSLSSYPEDVDHYIKNGDIDMKHALWADQGSTVHNIGKIYTARQNYDTQAGGILIGWPNNALKKQDDLIVLRGGGGIGKPEEWLPTTFINDGMVDMGITYHKIDIVLSILDLVFYKEYSDYTKNVINAENSNIINNGTIQSQGDKIYFRTDVQVGLAQYNDTLYKKNVILMNGGNLENSGLIQYERDRNAEVVSIVGVELLNLGLHYNREKIAVNSVNSNITNKVGGKIFVGGDLLEKRDYSGITANLIGADFVGKHNKYGVKANGGILKNYGTIEIERDFSKALDHNNNILDLYLIYGGVLELGLLSFDSMNEKSVGVSINNGTFYNDGGIISVGANNKKHALQILDSSAIAVEANNSKVYFNTDDKEIGTGKTSTINLEGHDVYATSLSGDSTVIFDGTTNINFVLPTGLEDSKKEEYIENINKKIFHVEEGSTGKHIVRGILKINGDFDNSNANLVIENGGIVEQGDKPKEIFWGTVVSTGTINLEDDIKISTSNLVGLSDEELKKYENHTLINADKGITGNGNLISDSYVFSIETDKTNSKGLQNDLNITNINRKNFYSIVDNKELGNILESSYEGAYGEKLDFYKYIALGKDQAEFSSRLNEKTGSDNITTLETQIMDITKDLNKQHKNFIKEKRSEGINFSYINSKSEDNQTSKYQGFERKSSGIITGYNKNISDNLKTGINFAYMKSDIDYTSKSSNKIETWNLRGYSDYNLKKINILTNISFAYHNVDNKRYVDNNLNQGETDIYTLGLNNSLYKNYKINEKLSFVPSINLDFTYYYQDTYKEHGKSPVNVENTDGIYMTLGTSAGFKYDIFSFGKNKISLVGNMEYAYDIVTDNENIKMELSNFGKKFSEEKREVDKKSLTYDLGINYEYENRYSVGLKYSKELINDIENEKIEVNFSYKF